MLSVVVPTYNEEANIARCLRALEAQTLPRDQIEVIVVDGESTDRTREVASALADKVVTQVSPGVGGARNDGFKLATHSIVATTDADCEPHHGWAQAILEAFRDPGVVAVTGPLEPFDWGDMGPLGVGLYKALFWGSNLLLRLLAPLGYHHLCGANSAFRREAFLEAGGYLPLSYADDVEIVKRLRGRVVRRGDVRTRYSVRRIRKLGLARYLVLLARMELEVMVLGRRPTKKEYARMDYG